MSDAGFNPNDPLFGVSRRLDADLSEAEHEALERELSASDSLRAEARALENLDCVLKRWALTPIELDWHVHALHAIDRISSAPEVEEADGSRLNELLASWNQPSRTGVDEERFVADVMSRIGKGAGSGAPRRSWGNLYRIGAPLAMAALIALAALPLMRLAVTGEVIREVAYIRTSDNVASLAEGGSTPSAGTRVAVAFGRSVPAGWSAPKSGIGIGFVGSGDVDEDWTNTAPVYVP
jgi:hypothetical protein